MLGVQDMLNQYKHEHIHKTVAEWLGYNVAAVLAYGQTLLTTAINAHVNYKHTLRYLI